MLSLWTPESGVFLERKSKLSFSIDSNPLDLRTIDELQETENQVKTLQMNAPTSYFILVFLLMVFLRLYVQLIIIMFIFLFK